jgi:hypothetical protein
MGRILGAVIRIERPLNEILGEAETVCGAGMIEDNAIRLARGRAQSASDHLPVEAQLLGGPRQNQAAERWHIPAFGQHHAVRDNLDFARRQLRQRCVALVHRRGAIDVFGADAG